MYRQQSLATTKYATLDKCGQSSLMMRANPRCMCLLLHSSTMQNRYYTAFRKIIRCSVCNAGQSAQPAWFVCRTREYDHITPVLQYLHWLGPTDLWLMLCVYSAFRLHSRWSPFNSYHTFNYLHTELRNATNVSFNFSISYYRPVFRLFFDNAIGHSR